MLNTYSSPIYAGESDVGAVVLQMLSGSGAKKASALGGVVEWTITAVLKTAGV